MILMHAPIPSVRSSQRIYFRKVRTDADSKSVHPATRFIHIPEHGLHMQTNAARFQTMPMLQGQTLPRVSCTPGYANAPPRHRLLARMSHVPNSHALVAARKILEEGRFEAS